MSATQAPSTSALASIPDDLQALTQWVLWRGEDKVNEQTREIRLNKIPINPQTLHKGDSTDPETWNTFAYCVQALPTVLEEWQTADPAAYRGGGLGFVMTADDPYAGIDLDHCRDPDTGIIEAWAQKIITSMASYTELSPSGTGLHIWVQGALPPKGRKKGQVEMYDSGRFFTMTGAHLPGTPTTIEARPRELLALHHAVFATQDAPQGTNGTSPHHGQGLDDDTLLAKARGAKNGAKFTRLWEGDVTDYPSPSEADMALCAMLAFWTQDAEQIDRLFQCSGLFRQDKWGRRSDYKTRTIAAALAFQPEQYTPEYGARLHVNGTSAHGKLATDVALPWSDTLNAAYFVRDHGASIRYCFPWKSWLVWNGRFWERDTTGQVMRLAKLTIKRLAQHAATIEDDDKMKALLVLYRS